MNTPCGEQTCKMLKTYLSETTDAFEKLDDEPGFLYRKTMDNLSLVFCARVDESIGFLLLNAYPGIYARQSCVSTVADYCQRISPELGVVCVEPDLCEVYYHADAFMQDAPVSRATLEILERAAFAALAPYLDTLRALSAGVLPETLPAPQEIHIPLNTLDTPAEPRIAEYRSRMETYFGETACGILAKHEPDGNGECYICELLALHRRWKLHITLNDEKTFFILKMFPGRNALVFNRHAVHAASQICNKESDDIKAGALLVGTRPEGVYAKLCLSALDNAADLHETLHSAVSVLVSILYCNRTALEKIAAGVPLGAHESDPLSNDKEGRQTSSREKLFHDIQKLESMQKFLAMTSRCSPPELITDNNGIPLFDEDDNDIARDDTDPETEPFA